MFTVTRQCQWPDGNNVVEVSVGGIDYCNADALCAKYAGEFQEFADPREAVETAIEICRAWRRDTKAQGKAGRITIGVGDTHGMTIPFEPETFAHARAWAKQVWNSLAKCSGCQKPMQNEKWYANDWDGLEYCSERCAERAAEFEAQQNAELTETEANA